ncbi:right-handed parallel beta-helix repeat-containing protein [Congregibacter brevis]|uniref:Right-handed parallel beta-helix repeat-containing protein n=1 Tax=Congregibacter brevis TaxID=3081201 RepID=A0ABZ0IF80_9GAMM|nr:right-handed parallel beta-helix repeat-containing protein [Congregibacter sp. IMCC45268]
MNLSKILAIAASTYLFASFSNACTVTMATGSTGSDIHNELNTGSPSTFKDVCLPAGTYYSAQTISIPKNRRLRGLGLNSNVIIEYTGSSTRGVRFSNNVTNSTLLNLRLRGSGVDAYGVLVYNASNITIAGVQIEDFGGIGIGINLSSNVDIEAGAIQRIGLVPALRQAIWTQDSSDVTIDGVRVIGAANGPGGDHAIACISSSDYTVKNVYSTRPGSGAIYLNDCDDFSITNNRVEDGSEFGIDMVNGSSNGIVSGNRIDRFAFGAMVIDDHIAPGGAPGTDPTNILLTNNSMVGNNTGGLATCAGINIDYANSSLITVGAGNTSTPSPIQCSWP